MKKLGFSGKGSLFLAWLLAVSFLFGISPDRALANGNETLGAPSIAIAPGSGIVAAGAGLVVQPGTIDINVPGTVEQALLYWECRGPIDDNTIVVDGMNVTGTLIGTAGASSASFRADITARNLVDSGPNSLTVSGLNCGVNAVNNGAGLLVIFDGGSAANAFSGEATVVRADLLGNPLLELVTAGPLPLQGGIDTEQLLGIALPIPGLLNINSGTATATTTGMGNQSQSQATLEGLALTVLGLGVSATAIDAVATATCDEDGNASVSGSSIIAALNVLGIVINITGQPNQVVNVLGLITLFINEQVGSAAGDTGEITVNALRINVLGLVDIVLSSAHADILCDGQQSAANIRVRDGADFAFPGSATTQLSTTVQQTFNFPSVNFDRTADLKLFVGNALAGKNDRIRIIVGGTTTNLNNRLDSSDGPQWDTENISVFIPAGVSQVKVRLFTPTPRSTADSIEWVLAALSVPTQPAAGITFSGRAAVLDAAVLAPIINATLVEAGPLPPQGGFDMEQLLTLNVPGLLSSGTATATTMGSGNMSESQATLENLNLNVLGLVTASGTVIDSLATATCDANGNASVSGSSQLTNLVVLGIPIVITGQPNQTVNVLGLVRLIINEQMGSATGGVGDITVTALRIVVGLGELNIADIRLSTAHADIRCN